MSRLIGQIFQGERKVTEFSVLLHSVICNAPAYGEQTLGGTKGGLVICGCECGGSDTHRPLVTAAAPREESAGILGSFGNRELSALNPRTPAPPLTQHSLFGQFLRTKAETWSAGCSPGCCGESRLCGAQQPGRVAQIRPLCSWCLGSLRASSGCSLSCFSLVADALEYTQ